MLPIVGYFPVSYRERFSNLLRFGAIALTVNQIAMIALAIAVMIAIHALLRYTRLGKAMRATAANPMLARNCGIPTQRVIDGVWLVSIALIQLHREQPWKAVQAYQAVYYMVALSALTNFGHGLIRFGVSWHGAAAGLAFAVLPISLKWLISASTNNRMGTLLKAPNAKSRLKDAGMVRAELELNEALQPLMNMVNNANQQPEPVQVPEVPMQAPAVKLERIEEEDPFEIPAWVNTPRAEIEGPKPVVPTQPNLVPAESPKVPTPVQITSRQDRVNDLAQRIAENGGQLGSVTFAQMSEWYGIDPSKKSTLSVLRKDAHQKYLDKATQGPYM